MFLGMKSIGYYFLILSTYRKQGDSFGGQKGSWVLVFVRTEPDYPLKYTLNAT